VHRTRTQAHTCKHAHIHTHSHLSKAPNVAWPLPAALKSQGSSPGVTSCKVRNGMGLSVGATAAQPPQAQVQGGHC